MVHQILRESMYNVLPRLRQREQVGEVGGGVNQQFLIAFGTDGARYRIEDERSLSLRCMAQTDIERHQ